MKLINRGITGTLGQGQAVTELVLESGDVFSLSGLDTRLVFRRNDQNGVVGAVLHAGEEIEGERVEPVEPGSVKLEQYAGRYYSFELEAYYTVAVDGEKLIAQNRRHGRIELSPTTPDMFRGDRWFLRAVAFERDAAGAVASMSVSDGDRARNLRFERQTGD